MTYEIQIRHSRPIPSGDGFQQSFESRRVAASSEEEAFHLVRQSCYDHIACIDAWHHQGVAPFSVDTGEPEFFTDTQRPGRKPGHGMARTG
jgi:hypothetical protein